MKIQILAIVALAGTAGTAVVAHAQTPETKDYTLNGYFDLYYQFDFGRPGSGRNVNGRYFDQNHNAYRVAGAELDIFRAPTQAKPLGFYVNLLAGDNTDILHATEPGGRDTYKNFGQAYISYLTGKATVDFGKFYTPIGYEGTDSRTQDNYSRSFNYTFVQPNYHTGIRASLPLTDKLTVTAYAVQGWNEVQDSNNSKSFIGSFAYSPTAKLSLTLQGYTGKEGSDGLTKAGAFGGIAFPSGGEFQLDMVDFIAVYNLQPDLKLVFNGDYASVKGQGNFNGQAVYLRKTFNSRNSGAIRLDRVEDTDGLRNGGTPIQLHSITATYDYNLNSNALLRFELRQDYANRDAFNADNGPKRSRTTFTFAEIVKF